MGSGCIDSSEDIIDEDQMWSTSVCHDVRALWQDREWVTLTLVDGFMTCLASGNVSGTLEVKVLKHTGVIEVVAALFEAVTVLSLCCIAMAVWRCHL